LIWLDRGLHIQVSLNIETHAVMSVKKRIERIVIIAILILVFHPYNVCFGRFFPTHNDVENAADLQFLASTQELEYDYHTSGSSCEIRVRFDIASAEFSAFAVSTQIQYSNELSILTNSPIIEWMRDKGWEQPAQALWRYRQKGLPDQWMMVDTTDTHRWTVYLVTVIVLL
jgi:hypothetical protein